MTSERVANIRVLYPGMTAREAERWRTFFRGAEGIQARYSVESLTVNGARADGLVRAMLRYTPAGGGSPREDRPRLQMRFAKLVNGWRVAAVTSP